MSKVGIGNKIDEKYISIVEEIHSKLGGSKYRIYEAAIDLFNTIPRVLQSALISYDEEEREMILDIISQMKLPQQTKKAGKKP